MNLFAACPSLPVELLLRRGAFGFFISSRSLSSKSIQSQRLDAKCWQVSSHGRCCNTRGRISCGSVRPDGYCIVYISGHQLLVHRLVAWAFLGPPPNQLACQVHHRDGNASNNHVHNLEYVTPAQNVRYSYDKPLRGTGGQKHSRPVMWRVVGTQSWTTCESMTVAAQQLGMNKSTISKCCKTMSSFKGIEFKTASLMDEHIPGEEWRQMQDPRSGRAVPGRMVSSMGRLKFLNGRISFGYLEKIGYLSTSLCLDFGNQFERVHRLVAAAFLGDPPTPMHTQVNHKDGDKANNCADNLEYVTPRENNVHRWLNAKSRVTCRSDSKSVESRAYGQGGAWILHPSLASAAAVLGVRPCNIFNCAQGRQRQTGGYEFRLAPATSQADMAEMDSDEEWRDICVANFLRDMASQCWSQPWLIALMRKWSTGVALFLDVIRRDLCNSLSVCSLDW